MAPTSDGFEQMVVPYGSYTAYTPALPEFYWDVYSAEQRVKHICFEIDKLVDYADMLGVNININHEDIETLKKQFDEFKTAGLAEFYEKLLTKWINENMPGIISESIKQVYFGLTDDGYFCAYIPDSWSEITFDTGMVFGRSDYGRLILKFDAQGSGVIDNTYSYSLAQNTAVAQLQADLETNTKRTDSCFDSLFTAMSQILSKAGDNA